MFNNKFIIESSVSAELISYLCKDIERNMYYYSANLKCFVSITEFSSKNYSPKIVGIHNNWGYFACNQFKFM